MLVGLTYRLGVRSVGGRTRAAERVSDGVYRRGPSPRPGEDERAR
jgi:hypothetical protein